MNLFKSIQHMVLASLVMTAVMPTVAVAMARNEQDTENRVQSKTESKAPAAKMKKTILNRIKDNWQLIAGGCAIVAFAVLLWNSDGSKLNAAPAARPAHHMQSGLVWIDGKAHMVTIF